MSAGVTGDFSKLSRLAKTLKSLGTSTVVAQKTAAAAAPPITGLGKASFDAGTDAYGVAWRPSKRTGKAVTLRRSGRLEAGVVYVALGTKLRAVLGVPYAKYQIGYGRPIFPRFGGVLPSSYSAVLKRAASAAIRGELGGG